MIDRPSPAAPARAPSDNVKTGATGAAGLALLVAAAVAVQAPRTATSEGTRLRAYYDSGRVATICAGHIQGVKIGDVATTGQCRAWLETELGQHTMAALIATPTLAEQPSALQQAGDFAFNAGDARWAASPMAARFSRREWRAGCEAFRGYITLYRAPAGAGGRNCRFNAKGVRYCEAAGLVARRERERAQCLAGLDG